MGRITRTGEGARKVLFSERFEHMHLVTVANSRNAGCIEGSAEIRVRSVTGQLPIPPYFVQLSPAEDSNAPPGNGDTDQEP